MNNHLCFTCKHAKKKEAEGKTQIHVSFGCKLKDTDFHNLVVILPQIGYVLECPKYRKVDRLEGFLRKYFWWM